MPPADRDIVTKNVHVEVDEAFHRRLKIMCAARGVTLKEYARAALESALNADERAAEQQKTESK